MSPISNTTSAVLDQTCVQAKNYIVDVNWDHIATPWVAGTTGALLFLPLFIAIKLYAMRHDSTKKFAEELLEVSISRRNELIVKTVCESRC